MPATGASPDSRIAANPYWIGKKKEKGATTSKGAAFATRTARRMPIDLLGEATPGPGSYMPASTFGKHERSAEKQKQRNRPSSAFKSTSPARPRASNEHVPGPGAHSPKHWVTSAEKKVLNPGASLRSKGKRFGNTGTLDDTSKDKKREPGPGEYNSHTHKTIQNYLTKKRQLMSRQNPGFGASSAAHTLPFEEDIQNDEKAYRESASVSSNEPKYNPDSFKSTGDLSA